MYGGIAERMGLYYRSITNEGPRKSEPYMTNTTGLTAFATDDDRQCDLLWARVEQVQDDPRAAIAAWQTVADAMERYFQMEETISFRAFEEASGMRVGGPTHAM